MSKDRRGTHTSNLLAEIRADAKPSCGFCDSVQHGTADHLCAKCKEVGNHRTSKCPTTNGTAKFQFEHMRRQISIPRFEEVANGEAGDKYTVYVIRVATMTKGFVEIPKTNSEFKQFHDTIDRIYPALAKLVPFRTHAHFRTGQRKENRRSFLELILHQFASIATLNDPMEEFFKIKRTEWFVTAAAASAAPVLPKRGKDYQAMTQQDDGRTSGRPPPRAGPPGDPPSGPPPRAGPPPLRPGASSATTDALPPPIKVAPLKGVLESGASSTLPPKKTAGTAGATGATGALKEQARGRSMDDDVLTSAAKNDKWRREALGPPPEGIPMPIQELHRTRQHEYDWHMEKKSEARKKHEKEKGEILMDGTCQKQSDTSRHVWNSRYMQLKRFDLSIWRAEEEFVNKVTPETVINCTNFVYCSIRTEGKGSCGGRRLCLEYRKEDSSRALMNLIAMTGWECTQWCITLTNAITIPGKVLKSGYLERMTSKGKWKKRYVTLTKEYLSYHATDGEYSEGEPGNVFQLCDIEIMPEEYKIGIKLKHADASGKAELSFRCLKDENATWRDAIAGAIAEYSGDGAGLHDSFRGSRKLSDAEDEDPDPEVLSPQPLPGTGSSLPPQRAAPPPSFGSVGPGPGPGASPPTTHHSPPGPPQFGGLSPPARTGGGGVGGPPPVGRGVPPGTPARGPPPPTRGGGGGPPPAAGRMGTMPMQGGFNPGDLRAALKKRDP